MAPRVVLVGPPGSGKTTVGAARRRAPGRRVPRHRRRRRGRAGQPVPDIFVEDGEAAFRDLERAAVARALADHDGVLALGGGAVLDPATRRLLRGQPRRRTSTWGSPTPRQRVGLQPRPAAARWATRAPSCTRLLEERRQAVSRAGDGDGRHRPGGLPTTSSPTVLETAAMTEPTRIHVGGDSAVRRRRRHRPARRSCRRCCGAAAKVAVVHPRALRPTAEAVRGRPPRAAVRRRTPIEVPDGEAAKDLKVAAYLLGRARRASASPATDADRRQSAAARRPTRRVRGRHLAARGARRPRPDDAARHGRRRGRRQDRDQHRRGQEPRRRVPPAGGRAVRPGRARDAAAQRLRQRARRGRQGGLHRRPPHPRADRGRPASRRRVRRPAHPRAGRARRSGSRRTSSAADLREAGTARDPQLRPHARPRHREGRALPLAARRGGQRRAGLRGRARPARRPARRRDRRPAPDAAVRARPAGRLPARTPGRGCTRRWRSDKKARGDRLRFVVLDGLGRPGHRSTTPTRRCSPPPTRR